MPTYRLDIAYDGSKFYGYAIQPNVPSVQSKLENALAPYTGGVKTHVAGRTDKGVHASQQVVSFTCEEFDTGKALRSLNSLLAPEIAAADKRGRTPGSARTPRGGGGGGAGRHGLRPLAEGAAQ